MVGKFDQMLASQGETISRYVHSFESSRDSTTNLKESQWAAVVNITAIVRSQPESLMELAVGMHEGETIVILTVTAIAKYDVVSWNSKYFDIVMVEEVFFGGQRQYYKGTCCRRIEFLGN